MRRIAQLSALALLPVALVAAPVLLISIDGMRPDYVTQADRHGLKIPNLRRFIAEGSYASGVTGVMPTVTFPSHTTLVTGVWPAKHNILSNETFDPNFENFGGWYWYASDLRAPTLWERADAAGIVTASLNWPVTVDAPGIRYMIPEYWRAKAGDDRKLMAALSRPDGWLRQLEAKLGPFTAGSTTTIEGDEIRTKFALEILAEKKPGFMTIHLTSLDHTEHETSPFSAESNKTLEELDGMIGRLMAAAVKNDPAAVVAIVSDHGFARTDHTLNLMVPFFEAGLMKSGEPSPVTGQVSVASWEAEPWLAGATAAIMLHHPNDAAVTARVKNLLSELQADPHNGIARVLEGDEIRKFGGFPNATFVVEVKPGYKLGRARTGPLVSPAPSTGMHGYLPDRPEMRASLFLLGRGIARARNLGLVDMRRTAPTLASILKVRFPTAPEPALNVAP